MLFRSGLRDSKGLFSEIHNEVERSNDRAKHGADADESDQESVDQSLGFAVGHVFFLVNLL